MLPNEGRLFTTMRFDGTDDDVQAQWLANRNAGIGGSDVAAIMGLSPWKSPLEVWLEKTHRREPEDISHREAVAMGTELEETVLHMYRKRHPERRPHRANASLTAIGRPWALASLDGITHDNELGAGVLEIKTGSKESEWEEGVPIHYLTQVVHYMSVTGYRFADVVALIGDRGLHYHEHRVLWDDDDIQAVVHAVDAFWADFVEKDVMPALVTPLASEGKALYEIYKRYDKDMTEAEGAEADMLAEAYVLASSDEADARSRKAECSNRLKRLVNEHKGIVSAGYVTTWVRSDKRDSGIRVKRKE